MNLNEVLKGFFKQAVPIELSSEVHRDNVLVDLGQAGDNSGIFFDNDGYNTVFGYSDMVDVIGAQRQKITKYRQVAMLPDVDEALDIIINEIIFSYDNKEILTLQSDVESEALNKKLQESFDKIQGLMNIKRNLFQIVKRGYIDGQMNLHCSFSKNIKDGIQSINLIEPCGLYYDQNTKIWQYESGPIHKTMKEVKFSDEEIVREDFGLYDGRLCLSYLEYAIKPSNMLKTLEDLLIPMRFSRSISRRVFNVDIADLPTKRGSEVMAEHQRKFKYKKFYNNETGEVTNQQHITSMVEDYWFANRGGGRGTTVDTIDESGNLGELGDILYFSKKLYRALKIPSNRLPDSDGDTNFDFDTTQTSKEDLQFFMFITRLRGVYTNLLKEVLKRQAISTGIVSADEWVDVSDSIQILFKADNKFIEKMNLDNFTKKLEIYERTQEHQGKLFSVETILKDVFKYSDEEIKDEFTRIEKERKNKLFGNFYKEDSGEQA